MPALAEIQSAWQRLLSSSADDEPALLHFQALAGDLSASYEQALTAAAEAAKAWGSASLKMTMLAEHIFSTITDGGDASALLAEQATAVVEVMERMSRLVTSEQRLAGLTADVVAVQKMTGSPSSR